MTQRPPLRVFPPSPPPEFRALPIGEVQSWIQDGDLLDFHSDPRSFWSDAIQWADRSHSSHSALVIWCQGVAMCGEQRELKGARLVSLARQVKKYPGRISVWRANADRSLPEMPTAVAIVKGLKPGTFYDRTAHAAAMCELAGADYGYVAIVKTLLIHLPLLWLSERIASRSRCLRWLVKLAGRLAPRLPHDSIADPQNRYCSAAVVDTLEESNGIHAVGGIENADTEPGDVRRCGFYAGLNDCGYIGTLVL